MKIPFVDLKTQYLSIKSEIDQTILQVIKDSSFIGCKYLKSFEQNFATYIGVRYCIGVGNGTDALFIALRTLNIREGDEVITVANSFIATSEAITMTGAKVVFVDCEKKTFNIDVKKIEEAITPKTRAIIPSIYMVNLQNWLRFWKSRKGTTFLLLKMQLKHMELNIKAKKLERLGI